jgi:hypothetical protein
VRMDSLPFSPPRVWKALREAEEEGRMGKPAPPDGVGAVTTAVLP